MIMISLLFTRQWRSTVAIIANDTHLLLVTESSVSHMSSDVNFEPGYEPPLDCIVKEECLSETKDEDEGMYKDIQSHK